MATRRVRGDPPDVVYGKHPGETIVVLGNSSSLRGMDLSAFNGITTIGLNRMLRAYEPTYLMVVDKSVIEDESERMVACCDRVKMLIFPGTMNSRCLKLYCGPWISTGTMTGSCDPTSKQGPIHICRGGNSAYEAVQIAYRMGAKRIALAGVDMYWPPMQDSHFFGSGQKAGCSLRLPDEKIEDFARLKGAFKTLGVEMFSVSPWDTPFRQKMGYVDYLDLIQE